MWFVYKININFLWFVYIIIEASNDPTHQYFVCSSRRGSGGSSGFNFAHGVCVMSAYTKQPPKRLASVPCADAGEGAALSVCPSCLSPLTVETFSPSGSPFSVCIRRICACGVDVQVKQFLDPDKCCSSFPLPGYDRASVRARLLTLGLIPA